MAEPVIDLQELDEGKPHWMSESSPIAAKVIERKGLRRDGPAKKALLEKVAKRKKAELEGVE